MRANATRQSCLWLIVAAMHFVIPACRNSNPVEPPLARPPSPVAVSVHVTYCKPVEPTLPIGDVHVQLASATDTLFAITNSSGIANFGAILPGSYGLELSRATSQSDPSCLSGEDVNELFTGVTALRGCAALAADVTQDGTVDAQDLAALRACLVFDPANRAHATEWRFESAAPVRSITEDTMLEVGGVVLGDVDLSWPNH